MKAAVVRTRVRKGAVIGTTHLHADTAGLQPHHRGLIRACTLNSNHEKRRRATRRGLNATGPVHSRGTILHPEREGTARLAQGTDRHEGLVDHQAEIDGPLNVHPFTCPRRTGFDAGTGGLSRVCKQEVDGLGVLNTRDPHLEGCCERCGEHKGQQCFPLLWLSIPATTPNAGHPAGS